MNQRMVGSMEPRGATASYDPATDSYTLRACSQSAGAMRDSIMAIMSLPKERIRVITEDVGGAFGIKTGAYPENIALMIGAKKLGRPIHWMRTARKFFSPTIRPATSILKSSWRSTTRESSWRCGCAMSPISAPMSARSAPIFRP